MAEKKLREGEKSPLTMSFNAKEESLLRKRMLSLDSMKKQAADSLTLDQKILYNQFTMKLRRSELAHAKLHGNRDLIKHLARTMFSSLNTTLNDGTEEAVRAILHNGKSLRAVSAPCRPTARVSGKDQSYRTDISHVRDSNEPKGMDYSTKKTSQRFFSAPGRRQSGYRQTQVKFLATDEAKNKTLVTFDHPLSQTWPIALKQDNFIIEVPGTDIAEFKSLPRTEAGTDTSDTKWPESNTSLARTRPKSTSFLSDTGGRKLQGTSIIMDKMLADREDHFENKMKLFIEKVKSMQQQDSTLRDYYSQRMLDGTGKKEISTLASKEEEQKQWMPVGEEPYYRSVTIKRLDRSFTRRDVPIDILLIEQYNMVLTNENYSVRNWINNNPYITTG